MTWKYLRKYISMWSVNVTCVYHFDLWMLHVCIVLICNVSFWYVKVIYKYHFDLWMLYVCIILIYECYITCAFFILFTYVLLGNKYIFTVIFIVNIKTICVYRDSHHKNEPVVRLLVFIVGKPILVWDGISLLRILLGVKFGMHSCTWKLSFSYIRIF